MICEQPGHLIHSPSGTRLAFTSVGAIGVRAFLNQAMKGQLIKNGAYTGPWSFGLGPWSASPTRTKAQGPVTPRTKDPKDQGPQGQRTDQGRRTKDHGLFRPWYVITCSRPHAADLFDQIVERFLASLRIEL